MKQQTALIFLNPYKCSFTLEHKNARMQFHSVSGAIETVCPISGTSEEENNLKAIASMLQVITFKIFRRYRIFSINVEHTLR